MGSVSDCNGRVLSVDSRAVIGFLFLFLVGSCSAVFSNFTYSVPIDINQNSVISGNSSIPNLINFTWFWDGTNYTMYNSSLVLMMDFDNLPIVNSSAGIYAGAASAGTGSTAIILGLNFTATFNSPRLVVSKYADCTATTAYLMDAANSTNLSIVSFVGNNATFDYNFIGGTSYWVRLGSGGSSYTRSYTGTRTVPETQGGITINCASDSVGKVICSSATAEYHNIQNLSFTYGSIINTTKIVDSSLYGNNGTSLGDSFNNGVLVGSPSWTTGKFGGGLQFNGSNQIVNVTLPSTPVTTAFWYYSSSTWTHVANVSGTLYVNGALGTPAFYPIWQLGTNIQIGRMGNGTYFVGSMDSVRVLGRALNASEVAAEVNSSRPVSGFGLNLDLEFEDGSGAVAQDSHNFVVGKFEGAGYLAGTTIWTNTTYLFSNASSFSGSAWVKAPAQAAGASVYAIGSYPNGLFLWIDGSGSINCYSKTVSTTSTPVSNSQFDYYTCDWNGTNLQFYKNGAAVGAALAATGANNNYLAIGRFGGGGGYFNGSVDGVRVWNRSLTAGEVLQQYRSNLAKYSTTGWLFNSTQNITNYTNVYSIGLFSSNSTNSYSTGVGSLSVSAFFDDCNSSLKPTGLYNYSVVFKFYDEDTFISNSVPLNFSFLGFLTSTQYIPSYGYLSSTFNKSYVNVSNVSLCIVSNYPLNYSSFAQFFSAGYSQRSYSILNASQANNSVSNIPLMSVTQDETNWVTFTMRDDVGAFVPFTYANVQRFYPESNAYVTVAIYETDANGVFIMPMSIPNPYYRVNALYANGSTLYTWSQFQIPSTNCVGNVGGTCQYLLQQLSSSGVPQGSILNAYQTSGNCTVNTTTNVSSCWYVNSAGLPQTINFTVYNVSANKAIVCSQQTSNSASGAFSCSLGKIGNLQYSVVETIYYVDQSWGQVASDLVNFQNLLPFKDYGKDGLILAIVIILGLTLVLAPFGIKMMLVGAGVGATASMLLGFVNIGVSGYSTAVLGAVISILGVAYYLVSQK